MGDNGVFIGYRIDCVLKRSDKAPYPAPWKSHAELSKSVVKSPTPEVFSEFYNFCDFATDLKASGFSVGFLPGDEWYSFPKTTITSSTAAQSGSSRTIVDHGISLLWLGGPDSEYVCPDFSRHVYERLIETGPVDFPEDGNDVIREIERKEIFAHLTKWIGEGNATVRWGVFFCID